MCRKCGTPKWRGDPCLNPDCVVNTRVRVALRARTLPMTVNAHHGYHAENAQQSTARYDAPIRNTRWVSGGR